MRTIGLLLFLISITSCNTVDPPPDKTVLTLTLEDVSCTEAWITLTTTNLQLPTTLNLLKDNNVTKTINLQTADTLLYIDSLLPNQTYKLKAISQSVIQPIGSNEVVATTLDTTSHNFTWQTWTFGEHSSSVLYDVAIINENNIIAVGEIYTEDSYTWDSLGNWIDPYNAVQWDGNKWELKRIYYRYNGTNMWGPIRTIFAFSENDIWYGTTIHWNGQTYEQPDNSALIGWSANKLWGSSSSDLYAVGNAGNIAHWDGSKWTKIESGTTTNINDAWGIVTNQNENIVYCPVSSFFIPGEKKIIKIIDEKVDSVSWNRDVRLYSAWAMRENFLYVCGEGAYESKFGFWTEINLPAVGTNSIRGNAVNDIFIVGDFGFITHYNGISWKVLSTFNDKGYAEVCIKSDVVAICGNYQGQGLIEIGKRN